MDGFAPSGQLDSHVDLEQPLSVGIPKFAHGDLCGWLLPGLPDGDGVEATVGARIAQVRASRVAHFAATCGGE